mmetsp:Transcript_47750/g.94230  ORF Transcript_47750/g.94230 Transcript_47750/m.94230 type:complete len:215 (-) Transcript_47750:869-1513(-)
MDCITLHAGTSNRITSSHCHARLIQHIHTSTAVCLTCCPGSTNFLSFHLHNFLPLQWKEVFVLHLHSPFGGQCSLQSKHTRKKAQTNEGRRQTSHRRGREKESNVARPRQRNGSVLLLQLSTCPAASRCGNDPLSSQFGDERGCFLVYTFPFCPPSILLFLSGCFLPPALCRKFFRVLFFFKETEYTLFFFSFQTDYMFLLLPPFLHGQRGRVK